MNKEPRKAIMTRTCLLNKYKKDNSAGNLFSYKGQRNLCVKLLRKSRKDFYNNRKSWQTVKLNFTGKTLKDQKIKLVDGDKLTTFEKDVIEKCIDHFEKIVETLKCIVQYCPPYCLI